MKLITRFSRAAMAGTLAVGSLLGSFGATSAQTADWTDIDYEPDQFTSGISDYDVAVAGTDFEITSASESRYQGGRGEMVIIESAGSILEVDFFDDDFSAQEDIDLWLDSVRDFERVDEIDSQYDENGGWAFYRVEDTQELSQPYYYYITEKTDVNGTRIDIMQSIWAPESELTTELNIAQEDVTISGDSFMSNISSGELEDMIASAETDATTTPNRLSGFGNADSDSPADATPTTTTTTGGTTDGDTYTFETADLALELASDSEFTIIPSSVDANAEMTVVIGPTSRGIVAYVDYTGDLESFLGGFIEGYTGGTSNIETLLEDGTNDAAFTIVNADDTIMLFTMNADIVDGGTVVQVLEVPATDLVTAFETFQNDVTLNGEPAMNAITPADLEGLVN